MDVFASFNDSGVWQLWPEFVPLTWNFWEDDSIVKMETDLSPQTLLGSQILDELVDASEWAFYLEI